MPGGLITPRGCLVRVIISVGYAGSLFTAAIPDLRDVCSVVCLVVTLVYLIVHRHCCATTGVWSPLRRSKRLWGVPRTIHWPSPGPPPSMIAASSLPLSFRWYWRYNNLACSQLTLENIQLTLENILGPDPLLVECSIKVGSKRATMYNTCACRVLPHT